ncbi:MAG TPA: hypothetical protein VHZ99_00105 [Steroidobacteraceae bacterium]|jgi:hypothetical protein|nr:hypothetical protein [Steroidobacteraceae bacterium]
MDALLVLTFQIIRLWAIVDTEKSTLDAVRQSAWMTQAPWMADRRFTPRSPK